jgi:hypothetical protein
MLNPDLAFDGFWEYFFLKHSYSSYFFAQTGGGPFLGGSSANFWWIQGYVVNLAGSDG